MAALRVRYQTYEFDDQDIHVRTLRDKQQYADISGEAEGLGISSAAWPMFGVVWPAGLALARLMHHYDIEGKTILEVGCGIGLASLVLNRRLADITATDQHPEAERFLSRDVDLNDDPRIPFVRTAWADVNRELGEYDLIIGSDVLYEREHAAQLAEFIDRHAKVHAQVIIADPGRRQQGKFRTRMVGLGYVCEDIQMGATGTAGHAIKARFMQYRK